MRRKVIALLLLAIMILGIGCSSNPQRESSSQGEVEGHGFKLVSEEEVADIRSTLFVYRHEKTGAELIWIKNDDPFKVFAVNFKTKPRDDKGVAHIIEHAVLGGSKKYYSNGT
ncbi:MAG: hypothetical protein Q4A41_06050 [Bacillota bacterium]|nr:hypothetical protein [Bacillota bacterium]